MAVRTLLWSMPSTMNCMTTGLATFGAAPRCARSAGASKRIAAMTTGGILMPRILTRRTARGDRGSRRARWENKKGVRRLRASPRTLRTHEPTNLTNLTNLENELQPELHDARIALIRVCAGDASERRAVHASRRVGEIHLVENIEELGPELDAHVVAEAHVFAQ